jgi:hypothetical protein
VTDVVARSFAACGVVGEIVTTDAGVQVAITVVCVTLGLSVKDPTARIDGTLGLRVCADGLELVPAVATTTRAGSLTS